MSGARRKPRAAWIALGTGVVLSFAVSLACFAVAVVTRTAALAWVAAVAAVIATSARSGPCSRRPSPASTGRDAIPFIQDLIARVRG
ncbi:hypothetical protein C5C31_08400 [Rathayibacter rathayi]|uniref:Lipoprotein n=1 Tax=Rathayibacter rathayi TaxID=33887 RepID=A0ABD6WAD4_RATRA|nr:hypothetical protein [Rathayibacter rathayi]AZZ50129.1 hypothetical protein C1O28_13810 [Rathayibacter rathayi]MWV74589.1 hypothetical protein [Rathayibacter rathayi NCPPB 2980 = VKM Ac-1601]PPF14572.1 hypothetical protein C5C04_06340 [Rathayibacter rathayi]PPF49723.1 hypothetical protein C5C08_06640 [Rathayibacter rathayi]PPF79583.1 hypothetical protein C5C14_08175 [Rathayibacter rathayi]